MQLVRSCNSLSPSLSNSHSLYKELNPCHVTISLFFAFHIDIVIASIKILNMNVNQLLHPIGPPRYSKVSLPSISDILYDLPPPIPVYPPPESRNYYLGRISPPPMPNHSQAQGLPHMTLPPLSRNNSHYSSVNVREHHHSPATHHIPMRTSSSSSSVSSSSSLDHSHSHHNHHQHSPTSPNAQKRKTRNNLPKETTYILLKWLNEHLNHPYPNSFEKNQLMLQTGLNQQQLSNWFINARRRKIKVLKRSESSG
ncbi:hypothetical protein CLIB1423_04S03994 [[Candida] railenensis]|uniref:Homeobox domain-containing protein n=1 Tax=[Candida] railenensis TaxID=45579 RepID=A0A9P0QM07_9ASCO|nr:hypothetical protein CLIB1423_04S03994 [[Candida] railenensis]